MWLLRILTCFVYARRTSWPNRPTDSTWLAGNRSLSPLRCSGAGHNSSASGRVSMPEHRRRKAIVDADIASSIQPDARTVIAFLDLLGDPVLDSRLLAADLLQCQLPGHRSAMSHPAERAAFTAPWQPLRQKIGKVQPEPNEL